MTLLVRSLLFWELLTVNQHRLSSVKQVLHTEKVQDICGVGLLAFLPSWFRRIQIMQLEG
jgi:hypothetical protein